MHNWIYDLFLIMLDRYQSKSKATNCLSYREICVMAASYVIIGVHGLANKPPEKTLTEYWTKSILEGLERNRRWKPAAPA